MLDWLFIAGAALAIAGWVMLKLTEPARASAAPAPVDQVNSQTTQSPPPAPNFLPVMAFDVLVTKTGVAGRLAKIQQRLGFAPENFARDVQPLLQRFAEFVQLLPASESHHHAQPGGLLIHLIEVAEYALHFRDSYKLPLGASTEEQMRLSARYSYAVLIAALLHDIGKPVADVSVQVVDATSAAPRHWVALAGPMREQGVAWYSVDFAVTRDYEAHRRLPVILLQRFVPDTAITWLGESKPLLQELNDYLSGDRDAGAIAEIVSKADRKSVADNLLLGPRTRFASARAVPMIERLMAALRRALAEGVVPLNRAGATGYCDGESLWCVAGSLAKTVREYLNQNETREPGASGVPEDNTRLFDTWQEYGALIPNAAGGAIWNVKICLGDWEQAFTVLRFPLAKLYPRPDLYPQALPPNSVQPIEASSSASTLAELPQPTAPHPKVDDSAETTDVSVIQISAESSVADHGLKSEPLAIEKSTEPRPQPITPTEALDDGYPDFEEVPQTSAPTGPVNDYLDESESAHVCLPTSSSGVPDTVQAPIKPKDRRSKPSGDSVVARPNNAKPRPNADRFMAWIQQGIGNGDLLYNESNACIHFVPEGMFVLSPKAFQEYARLCPDAIEIEPGKPIEAWRIVQRDFQRSDYPKKGEGGTYLHYYTVSGPAGKRLAGQLVADPGLYFSPVPASNPLIQSKSKTES